MRRFYKRTVSLVLAVTMLFSFGAYCTVKAVGLDKEKMTAKGMELGFSIINGYTKLALKNDNSKVVNKNACYVGLDISNPYLIVLIGLFYISNNLDTTRILEDNSYAMEKISELNNYLESKGIKNEKAEQFKVEYLNNKKIINSFDTIGLYIFEDENPDMLALIQNPKVDFVMTGGEIPKSMKDLNIDGRSDKKDALLIQDYLCKNLVYKDKDENEYIKYACDINGDKKINIQDVTDLQRNKGL